MKITDLHKQLGSFSLEITALTLHPGAIYGVVGHNGCGKSTLIKCMGGVLPPDHGTLDYEGLTARERTLLLQKPYILHASVEENLRYPLRIRGEGQDMVRIAMWLEKIGLYEHRKQNARSLSGGEQKKLAMARALLFYPRLLLLDEAFANMDMESTLLFEEILRERKHDTVSVLISHEWGQLQRICDKLLFLEQGRLLAQGTPQELRQHTDARVRQYFTVIAGERWGE